MKKIDEQIQWYKQNSTNLYDDLVSIELEKINSLYDRYEDHTNELFVEEMIESFCKIIEKQRERITDLESETAFSASCNSEEAIISPEDFQDDKQIQFAFTQYCLRKGISSYTVNDYCSRIKNLWKSFEDDHRNNKLDEYLHSNFPQITWESVLMNVYDSIDLLGIYIKEKIAETNGNRNWLNARAALNKFDEFKLSLCQAKKQ